MQSMGDLLASRVDPSAAAVFLYRGIVETPLQTGVALLHAPELHAQKLRHLLEQRRIVADTHRTVMGRRQRKPLVHVGIQIHAEVHVGLRIADGEDRQLDRLALAGDQAQPAVAELREPQHGNGPADDIRFNGDAAALLAVVDAHAAKHRLAVGDGDVEGAVVPQQHGVVRIVHGHDLAEAASQPQRIADLHRNAGLDVRLSRAGDAIRGQQGMTHDEAALELLVVVVVGAVVVVPRVTMARTSAVTVRIRNVSMQLTASGPSPTLVGSSLPTCRATLPRAVSKIDLISLATGTIVVFSVRFVFSILAPLL